MSLSKINEFLWGFPMITIVLGVHLYFTVRLKFIQRKTLTGIKESLLVEDDNDSSKISGFRALATTLAATLGTGNIIGMSTAIALGGAGAVFWCWLTGVLGMATSYAECYLSLLFREKLPDGNYAGGPMYVCKNGLKNMPLGKFYALCTIVAAFGVGCTTQSNAIVTSLSHKWDIPPAWVGAVICAIAGCAIIGGIRTIGMVCEKAIPFLFLFYTLCCLFILYFNLDVLPESLMFIVKSAFHPQAAVGGFGGYMVGHALRYGIARGLFTNEAGLGTGGISAASAHTHQHSRQALISMTAVFWDTVVMCAITGIVIVSNILKHPESIQGCGAGDYTAAAFAGLPLWGEEFLIFAVAAFALTTLIGWCYFGETAVVFLFGTEKVISYKIIYILMIFVGAVMSLNIVWELTDFINAVMLIPNVIALLILRDKIKSPTEKKE